MTMHEQVAVVLFGLLFGSLFLLWIVDTVSESISDHLSRARTWREIEVRCSMERHPSFQASLYDWEEETGN